MSILEQESEGPYPDSRKVTFPDPLPKGGSQEFQGQAGSSEAI